MKKELPETINEEPVENLIVPIEDDTLVFTLDNGEEYTFTFYFNTEEN
jgi:hypothetical protein